MKRVTFVKTLGKAGLAMIAGPAILSEAGCPKTAKGPASFTTNTPLPSHLFFPDTNVWNTPIPKDAKIDPQSDAILLFHSGGNLEGFARVECAIPYNVIDTQKNEIPFITIKAKQSGEDDPATDSFPYMPAMKFESGTWKDDPAPEDQKADHHLLVVDTGGKYLYEIYQLRQLADNTWVHEGAARFDISSNKARASSYQDSADAAGLPILPGLVRMDEIINGVIPHALRMTVGLTLPGFIFPATHGTYTLPYSNPPSAAPMGARFRLKSSVDENNFDSIRKPIITCLKTYGAFIADNGTSFAITADNDDDAFRKALGDQFYGPDPGKGDDASFRLLDKNLKDISIGDFELISMGPITRLP